DKWYSPHSEPDKTKKRASEFPHFVIDPEALTLPEVTTPDKWYRNLDEPVLPRVLPISNYPATFFEQEVSELDPSAESLAWFVELSVPTLPKPRVVEFPAYVIDTDLLTQPEATTLDRWWRELSEPVRVKARFHEALQLHVITDITFDIAEIVTLDKWYTPLGEPVRLGDRLVVPFRLPASVGREYQVAVIPVKGRISKEADQTHISKEADQTHISKEADQTKDSKRC
ncbi:hypothetical protein LCGC14_2897110, partial [marine sediment metagenome]